MMYFIGSFEYRVTFLVKIRPPEVDFLHSWAVVLGQIFRQIVSIRVMTLINTNVVASRHIKREEVLLPVAVHRSKTPELHFTNYRFSFCFVPFRFVSLHFVSQTTVSRKIFILVKLLRKHVMIIERFTLDCRNGLVLVLVLVLLRPLVG